MSISDYVKDYTESLSIPKLDIKKLTSLDNLPIISNDLLQYEVDTKKYHYLPVVRLHVYNGARYIEKIYYLNTDGTYRNAHIDQRQRIQNQKVLHEIINTLLLLTSNGVKYELYGHTVNQTAIMLTDSMVKRLFKIINVPRNLVLYLKDFITNMNPMVIQYNTKLSNKELPPNTLQPFHVYAEYGGQYNSDIKDVSIANLFKRNANTSSRVNYTHVLFKSTLVPINIILFNDNRRGLYNSLSVLGKWDNAKFKRCADDMMVLIKSICQVYKNVGRYTSIIPEIESVIL